MNGAEPALRRRSGTTMQSIVRAVLGCALAVMMVPVSLSGGELPAEEAWSLIERLQSEDPRVRLMARERLIEADDTSIAPALVELLFFSRSARADAEVILRTLFDTDVERKRGSSYQGWFELIGSREDIVPKEGYVAFKAREYGRIDPAFARFLDPKHPRTIRPEEIIFGGVGKDGIPALIDPPVIPASTADYLRDDEIVFGVEIDGEARAYPQRVMVSHEMANDVVGGKRVSLAYCTLCGSAILYDTTIQNRRSFTFGSSGLLYRSNKLMYDHQTDTLWSQILGEPVMGPLAGSGLSLDVLPVTLTSWAEWKRLHPDTTVLSLDTGYARDYSGLVYEEYFGSDGLMFPVWKQGGSLDPKEQVYVVELDGTRRAYPVDLLRSLPVLHDEIDGTAVVILTTGGGTVRAYRSGTHRFEYSDPDQLRDVDGVQFSVTESALVSADRSISLERLPGHHAYWFGIFAQYDEVEVYRSVDDAAPPGDSLE